MRALARHIFTLFAVASLLLSATVCVLWVRGRTGYDAVEWAYDRYLPDGSAASNQVHLTSHKRRLWLSVNWGQVGPYNGSLVWGYHVNADQSGGRPRLRVHHVRYDAEMTWVFANFDVDAGTSGWGPLRWQSGGRSKPTDGDESRYIRIGVSHWLPALLLLMPPLVGLSRFRQSRRARKLGICPICRYDLRATPRGLRCPECGTITPANPNAGPSTG